MDFSTINFWAVLVCGAVSLFLGFIWYSKPLFGKAWMKESGMTEEKAQKSNMALTFGLTFILSLLMALTLAFFFRGGVGFTDGLLYGAMTGIFWVGASLAILYLFEHHSLKLWLINAGYLAVLFTIMGGIIGAWH